MITTLDPVLGRSLGERRHGGSIGGRVGRALTPRLSAELSVDYSLARPQITRANSEAIEATRASFISAFDGLIRFQPNRAVNSLTSTAALQSGDGHQLFTSGALVINLRTTGDLIPYATVGVSLVSTTGKMPSATLKGTLQTLDAAGQPGLLNMPGGVLGLNAAQRDAGAPDDGVRSQEDQAVADAAAEVEHVQRRRKGAGELHQFAEDEAIQYRKASA